MAYSDNALTTVATLAAELGIATPAEGSAAETDFHRRIAVASSAIERFCARKFTKATLTEKVKSYGTQALMVSRTPVLSITSVTYREEDAESADDYTCTGRDADAGLIRRVDGTWEDTSALSAGASGDSLPGTEQADYTVVYVGGYVLPKDEAEGNPRTLPYELEEACLLECVASYRARGRDAAKASESLMSASVTYRDTATLRGSSGLLASVEAMLAPFRRWA